MAADIQMQDIKEEALAKIQEITGIIPGIVPDRSIDRLINL